MKVRDIVKIVYDDVEIIFKGPGAFNKYEAYRSELLKDNINYKAYWKTGLLGIKWSRMYTTSDLSSNNVFMGLKNDSNGWLPNRVEAKVSRKSNNSKIRGKKIYLEKELTYFEVQQEALSGNRACLNFILESEGITYTKDNKFFYGKVLVGDCYLGYIVNAYDLEEV